MAERSRRWPGFRRVAGGGLLVAALASGLMACNSSNDERTRENCDGDAACAVAPSTGASATPIDLQFRPVLSTTAASVADNPCPTDLPTPVPTETVVAPGCDAGVIVVLYGLGPSLLDGSAVESARAVDSPSTGEWVVSPVLKQGPTGIDLFNAAAAHCYARDETCPTGELAIVVDGVVISAPAIQQASFQADQIQITGGPFTEAEATALAAGIDAAG